MDMDAFITMLGVCIGGTVDQKLNGAITFRFASN